LTGAKIAEVEEAENHSENQEEGEKEEEVKVEMTEAEK
jgi:hypothetical protein